jgi:hypothetical protein
MIAVLLVQTVFDPLEELLKNSSSKLNAKPSPYNTTGKK